MAALTSPNPLGYAPGDPVTSAQMNSFNTQLPKAPNFVDGDAEYNIAVALTIGGAGFRFSGSSSQWISGATAAFASGSAANFASGATLSMLGTMSVGSAGLIAVLSNGEISVQSGGRLDVESGGTLNVRDGALAYVHDGATWSFNEGSVANFGGVITYGASSETYGDQTLKSGASITMESGSELDLGGTTRFSGTQPSVSADPGVNNRICGTNTIKAWAVVRFDGGTVTVLDGYNVSDVDIDGSINSKGRVTFARSMSSANYSVTYGVGGNTGSGKFATTLETDRLASGFHFNVWSLVSGTVVDLTDAGTDVIVSINVVGRQG